jgi:hypothetical protein
MSQVNAMWRTICELANVDPEARGALDAVHLAVGEAVGRGTLQRITEGTQPRLASLTKLARALGTDAASLLAGSPSKSGGVSQVDQAVSQRTAIVPPKELVWEDLVGAVFEGQFILAIKGDALMPQYMPGQSGIWQAGATAKPGQPVLIRLPGERFELRYFEDRGATWAGVSQKVGHRDLTPERDGAEIVARLRYIDLD